MRCCTYVRMSHRLAYEEVTGMTQSCVLSIPFSYVNYVPCFMRCCSSGWFVSWVCICECAVIHACVSPDSFPRRIWLIFICDMTHWCVWRHFICDMTHWCVWRVSDRTWLIHTCNMTLLFVWRDFFTCVMWLICTCGMSLACLECFKLDLTHSNVWYVCSTFRCVISLIHMCDMTSCHWFICVTWRHVTVYTYLDSLMWVMCFKSDVTLWYIVAVAVPGQGNSEE